MKGKIMKEKFMKEALKQAEKAYKKLEVPVGAVIVKDNKIIARAYNQKEEKNDTTNHAEIMAINSRIKKVYIGAMDEKTGACGSVLNLLEDYKFNHKVEVETGVLKNECEEILKKFFRELRDLKKSK